MSVRTLKILRFSQGLTRTDNEYIRGTAHGERFGNKVREIRLKRELTGRRITGRPQKRSM